MKNLSVRVKYSIPAFFLIIALILNSLIYSSLVSELDEKLNLFTSNFLTATEMVINADRDLHQARIGEISYVFAFTDKEKVAAKKYFKKNANQAKYRFEEYLNLMKDYPSVTAGQKSFFEYYEHWYKQVEASLKMADGGIGMRANARKHLWGESIKSFDMLGDLYDDGREMINKKATELKEKTSKQIAANRMIATVISLLVIALATIVSLFLLNQLKLRLSQVSSRIHDYTEGDGDLTKTLDVDSKDELGQLAVEFNAFVDSLAKKIAIVKVNAADLNGESSGLLSSANSSNQSANGLSLSSEQIVSAIHQLAQSIKEMADSAHTTATNTKNASHLTSEGITSVERSVVEIKELESNTIKAGEAANNLAQSSNEISLVVDVIKGIADQTNLLALNAAIEAARAGEQGRGFAVVADEVRSLANKTQESTDSIQGMIESIQVGVEEVVKDVETGRKKVADVIALSDAAKAALNEVNDIISTIELMSQQTATATEEQSHTVEEINKNTQELNDEAQNLLGVSNATSQASENITDLTGKINQSVDTFKVRAFK